MLLNGERTQVYIKENTWQLPQVPPCAANGQRIHLSKMLGNMLKDANEGNYSPVHRQSIRILLFLTHLSFNWGGIRHAGM